MNIETQGRLKEVYKKVKRDKFLLILLLPVVVQLAIFSYIPMYGVSLAFKDFRIDSGILGSPWVGFKYFIEFFNSIYFLRLLQNTFLINLYFLIFGFPIPIIFALAINEVYNQSLKRIVQTVSYFPHFISNVIIVSMMVSFLDPVSGIGFKLISTLGYEGNNIMADPAFFKPLYVFSGIWQNFGWNSIIYIAAITGIDVQIYESAIIDGISRFKKIFYITLPMIKNTIIVLLILDIGSMLSLGTEKIILMYSPGVYEVGDVIQSYVYRMGVMNAKFSFATAVGFFNSTINLLLLVGANSLARKYSETSLW